MRCPVDKNDMIVVEHQKIELDFCLRCAGVSFDASELDLFSLDLSRQRGHKCLRRIYWLLKKLREGRTKEMPYLRPENGQGLAGKDPKVLIDSCPTGDGLWFDGGELRQVLQQIDTANPKDVLSFLGNAFPKQLIKQPNYNSIL